MERRTPVRRDDSTADDNGRAELEFGAPARDCSFCAVQPRSQPLGFSTVNQPECEECYALPTDFNSTRFVLRDRRFPLFSIRRGLANLAHRQKRRVATAGGA